MNIMLIISVVALIVGCVCSNGPVIFRFTQEPQTQDVLKGSSVTLHCTATGRNTITYSWYRRLSIGLETAPTNSDLISGDTGQTLIVSSTEVDDSGEKNMFQCKATADNDFILSSVATVNFVLDDDIQLNGSRGSFTFDTSNDDQDSTIFINRLECNSAITDIDAKLTNGKPYNVYWYKDGESGRVEDNHDNMWTSFTTFSSGSTNLDTILVVTGSAIGDIDVKRYDLVLFNLQKLSDSGTYKCIAKSEGSEKLIGTTTLDVRAENNQYKMKSDKLIVGYTVQAVDSSGKQRTKPNVGDNILLMCGTTCKPSTTDGDYNAQYQWTDETVGGSGTTYSTREITVTITQRTSSYKCDLLESKCGSLSETLTVSANGADPDVEYTISTFNDYMWYDRKDTTMSTTPFEIDCSGSGSGVIISGGSFFTKIYKNGNVNDAPFDFSSSYLSDKSGVYQCAVYDDPTRKIWVQKTTTVMIADPLTVTLSPSTALNIEDGKTATFTCVVGGHPITSVIVTSGVLATSIDCMASSSSSDGSCSPTDDTNYVVEIPSFSASKTGTYNCKATSIWYKAINNKVDRNDDGDITLTYVKKVVVTLTTDPDPAEIDDGNTISFTCIVTGYPEPTTPVLAKKNDSSKTVQLACDSGTNVKTCTGTLSQYTDSGTYVCSSSNTYDSKTHPGSAEVIVSITKDVEVTLTHSAGSIDGASEGSSLTFTCEAVGNLPPNKLTFKKAGSPIKSFTGSTSDNDVTVGDYSLTYQYTIDPLALSDSAEYTCESEHDNDGMVVKSVSFKVFSDVIVTASTSEPVPTIGDQFTITCSAKGGDKPYFVQLSKGGSQIATYDTSTGSGKTDFCNNDVNDDFNLICKHTITTDYSADGSFVCTGKNKVASSTERVASQSVDITVSNSVQTSIIPVSKTEIDLNLKTYTVTCNVDGAQSPHKITLSRPNSASTLTWSWTSSSSSSSNTLTCNKHSTTFQYECEHRLSTINYSMGGSYTCTGYNYLPGDTTNEKDALATTSIVVVKDVSVTMSTTGVSNDEVEFGKPFTITCVAKGGRIPHYFQLSMTGPDGTKKKLVDYDKDNNKTPGEVTVEQATQTLTLVYEDPSGSYTDTSGDYMCLGKNRAKDNVVKQSEQSQNIVLVKNVSIDAISNFETDFGAELVLSFTLDGGRAPYSVVLTNDNSMTLISWSTGGSECTGKNELSCTKTIIALTVDFTYDGIYTVIAKNKAVGNTEVTATETFKVTIFQDVTSTLTPGSDGDITYDSSQKLSCQVIGGLPPHKVELTFPDPDSDVDKSLTWLRDDSSGSSLACSGQHNVNCEHTFTPKYNSDGNYKCMGYNKVQNGGEKHSLSQVSLTTIRATEVSVKSDKDSLYTSESVAMTCTVVGKPLVDQAAVLWTHESKDLTGNFTIQKGVDDFTWVSILELNQPTVEYSGSYTCAIAIDHYTTKSATLDISIAERDFLEKPVISLNSLILKTRSLTTVTCLVKGFPEMSVSVKAYDKNTKIIDTVSEQSTSRKEKELVFTMKVKCAHSTYECSVITAKEGPKSALSESLIIEGCGSVLPVAIGGGVGGVVFFVIVGVLVFVMIRVKRRKKNSSYSPKNGIEFQNAAYSPDPTYNHLDRSQMGKNQRNAQPATVSGEDGYASISQFKDKEGDGYATLDSALNRPLVKRQDSSETYAHLNRPAPGKDKRGVISRYKPISRKPPSIVVKPGLSYDTADEGAYSTIDGSSKSNMKKGIVGPDNSTYSTIDKSSQNAKNPDLEEEDEAYSTINLTSKKRVQKKPSKIKEPEPTYSTIDSNTKKKDTLYSDMDELDLPPEVPIYHSMGTKPVAEDPVYAQVNPNLRSVKRMIDEPEEEFPPDVPVYGTMGEVRGPAEDEDTYATVEFKPKSSGPSRISPPKNKQQSSGVYATISDFQSN